MIIDHDGILEIIRQTAEEEILPLWKNLHAHQVEEKKLDDFVTVADRACEERLSRELTALLPDSLVIGEEAAHTNPGALASLDSVRPVWVIDPLDGTNNFARGEEPFAVMVCLIKNGETLGAWIYDPLSQSILSAEQGAGAMLNDQPLLMSRHSGEPSTINGALSTKYLPDAMKPVANAGAAHLGRTMASGCAGFDYRALAMAEYQFQFYYRTLLWDHAPGAFITVEAGGVARRYNGAPYRPRAEGKGLITACDEDTWEIVKKLLIE